MTTADGVNPAGISRREYQRLAWGRLGAILDRLDYLEALMSQNTDELRDDFNAGLAEVGRVLLEVDDNVGAVADYIGTLRADTITQSDLDQLTTLAQSAQSTSGRLRSLAEATPEIPTEGGAGGGTEPTPEPTPEPAPGEGEAPA